VRGRNFEVSAGTGGMPEQQGSTLRVKTNILDKVLGIVLF
jgi:hypothetical protein